VTFPTGTTAQRPVSPTAGTTRYNTTIGNLEAFVDGIWKPIFGGTLGRFYGDVGSSSGTTQIPWDNTAPQITEGTQLWSVTVTPKSADSKFEIRFFPTVDTSANNRYVTLALFRGNTCISSSPIQVPSANRAYAAVMNFIDEPITTSNITYSLRVGIGGGGGTWYVNSSGSGNNMGGTLPNTWIITEFE
jgi:hypothetical protein